MNRLAPLTYSECAIATTLRTPARISAVATEANWSAACSSTLPDWHALSTIAGTAHSRSSTLNCAAPTGSGSPRSVSKISRPSAAPNISTGSAPPPAAGPYPPCPSKCTMWYFPLCARRCFCNSSNVGGRSISTRTGRFFDFTSSTSGREIVRYPTSRADGRAVTSRMFTASRGSPSGSGIGSYAVFSRRSTCIASPSGAICGSCNASHGHASTLGSSLATCKRTRSAPSRSASL